MNLGAPPDSAGRNSFTGLSKKEGQTRITVCGRRKARREGRQKRKRSVGEEEKVKRDKGGSEKGGRTNHQISMPNKTETGHCDRRDQRRRCMFPEDAHFSKTVCDSVSWGWRKPSGNIFCKHCIYVVVAYYR